MILCLTSCSDLPFAPILFGASTRKFNLSVLKAEMFGKRE